MFRGDFRPRAKDSDAPAGGDDGGKCGLTRGL